MCTHVPEAPNDAIHSLKLTTVQNQDKTTVLLAGAVVQLVILHYNA